MKDYPRRDTLIGYPAGCSMRDPKKEYRILVAFHSGLGKELTKYVHHVRRELRPLRRVPDVFSCKHRKAGK